MRSIQRSTETFLKLIETKKDICQTVSAVFICDKISLFKTHIITYLYQLCFPDNTRQVLQLLHESLQFIKTKTSDWCWICPTMGSCPVFPADQLQSNICTAFSFSYSSFELLEEITVRKLALFCGGHQILQL